MHRYDIAVLPAKFANGRPGLEKRLGDFLAYAVRDGCGAILVVLDADADCPLELATTLSTKVVESRLSVPVAIACAKSEFETWFICTLTDASGQSMSERLHIPLPVNVPDNIEDVRDAKGWLQNQMNRSYPYNPAMEQDDLVYHINIESVLDRSRSFRRFCHAVEELAGALDSGLIHVTPAPSTNACAQG